MQGTMKACRLHKFGEQLRVEDVPIPDIGPGEILIRVRRAGLNVGDVLMRDGKIRIQPGEEHRYFPVMPLTIGHDGSGEVAEVGPEVYNVQVGDKVVTKPMHSCGFCKYCRSQRDHLCLHVRLMGFFAAPRGGDIFLRYKDGMWAEYARLRATNIEKLRPEDDIDRFCLISQIGVGYRALKRARLGVGETVAINGGTGITGIGAVLGALAIGAAHVIVIARDPGRLERVRQINPQRISTISILTESIRERLPQLAGGEGPSVLVDLTTEGIQSTVDCLYCLEPGGRAALIGGNTETLELPYAFYLIRSIEFISSRSRFYNDFPELIELTRRGVIDPSHIRPRYFKLEEINEALDSMRSRPAGDIPLWPMMRID